ncbi:MAG TPA: response regulator [Steroidobacteraceae bacterium]|nr:response regulator [Steroidobacteraceae bacterium]
MTLAALPIPKGGQPAPPPPEQPAPRRSARSGKAVLVADDHPGNRQLVCQLLEFEGFARVHAVASGVAAISAWEGSTYDVVLLDWHMPGLDGLEVVRRIRHLESRRTGPRSAVLMVTGRVSEADRAACLAAGADECVAKPYTPDELLDALDRALRCCG